MESTENSRASTLLSPKNTFSSTVNTSPLCGALGTTGEPTLTHLYRPKSAVYMRVHASHCAFCGFGKKCKDVYHHHSITENNCAARKSPYVPPLHPSLPQHLEQPLTSFFPQLFQYVMWLELDSMWSFQIHLSLSSMHLRSLYFFLWLHS